MRCLNSSSSIRSRLFSKGELVLLGAWPQWLLAVLILLAAVGLALLLARPRARQRHAQHGGWAHLAAASADRGGAIAASLAARPGGHGAQPRQNIVAMLVDDSRSMSQTEDGSTREEQAVAALQSGVLDGLQRKFQTRLYRFDATSHPQSPTCRARARRSAPATHIGASLEQLLTQTEGLPLGAVVLLSDGGDNAGGVDRDASRRLRNHRIPVYTVGFGPEQAAQDVEIEDVVVPSRALAGSRLSATVKFQQRGYAGRRSTLECPRWREGAERRARSLWLRDGQSPDREPAVQRRPGRRQRPCSSRWSRWPARANRANNTLTRLVNVEPEPRRILYFEGEPRWEYKFIRRAAEDDRMIQLVSMLRTTENKIYRQGVGQAAGACRPAFPARAHGPVRLRRPHHRLGGRGLFHSGAAAADP